MDPSQASLPLLIPVASQVKAIPPSQVWRCLTPEQQNRLLHAVVLVCQELTQPLVSIQESEAPDE